MMKIDYCISTVFHLFFHLYFKNISIIRFFLIYRLTSPFNKRKIKELKSPSKNMHTPSGIQIASVPTASSIPSMKKSNIPSASGLPVFSSTPKKQGLAPPKVFVSSTINNSNTFNNNSQNQATTLVTSSLSKNSGKSYHMLLLFFR